MTDKVFCVNCRKDVDYIIEEKEMTGTIRGTVYKYKGKEVMCAECGENLDVWEIGDYNLTALYDKYRSENGIISLEKVRALPERYKIGKRPLSVLLGWGEHTLERYLDGDIPTRQYSQTLENLYEDPGYYLNLLEAGREKISKKSYAKSRMAAEVLLGSNEVECSEAISSVIVYLIDRCEDITPLALQKALYYIQGFFYAFYSKFIFEEDCEAWAHGPVYRNVYKKYADYHFNPISDNSKSPLPVFSREEKAVIDSVINNICCYSGKILEAFTHSETPWIETRGETEEDSHSDKVIDRKAIGDFFLAIKEKYGMKTPDDIFLYSSDLYSTVHNKAGL